jgi:hypothetical protein
MNLERYGNSTRNPAQFIINRMGHNLFSATRMFICIVDCWPSKMGLIGCSKTSVRNYHYPLHNNPEEHSCHLLHGRSLKSRRICFIIWLLRTWLGCKQMPTVLGYVFSDVSKNLAMLCHRSKCLWCTHMLGGTFQYQWRNWLVRFMCSVTQCTFTPNAFFIS